MAKVKDVMRTEVQGIGPEATVKEAAERMAALEVVLLPVLENDYLLGTISAYDIVARSTAAGRDPRSQPVKTVMNRGALSCREDQEAGEAAALMSRELVRRLPVVTAENRVTGMLLRADVVAESEAAR